jgi:hypothetical protein
MSAPVTTNWIRAIAPDSNQHAVRAATRACFQVQVMDVAGNVGAWSAPRCLVGPWDDAPLRASSTAWSHGTGPGYLRGTFSDTFAKGAGLTSGRPLTVKRLGVIARTCPTCGSLDLYVGATKVGSLSLVSRTLVTRRLLVLATFPVARIGVVRIVTAAANRYVRIDAVAISSV